ncbi:MAG: NUDIX domain-containing protein [bacterium]|nr:NUDIX domain-containing protein [bacterium]
MARQTLNKQETQNLVKLLKKVRLPAPYPVFIALCKSVPMVAVNLAVMPDNRRLLLTYRNDEFYKGWHIPGSILRYKENPLDVLKRVSRQELKMKIKSPRFVNYFIENSSRGHELILLFVVRPAGALKKGKYFSLNHPPKDLLKEQVQEVRRLARLVRGLS